MNTPNFLEKTCARCGAPVPPDAPEGLCPRCLGALPLDTETVPADAGAPASPPLTPEELAPHFPNLEILECLGRGGMGVVYKARQKSLGRLVALKLLAPERTHDAAFEHKFAQEARALAALNHPNIVTIHDFGRAGGFFYLIMEYVDGVNLRAALRGDRFTPEQALAIVPPVCEALQYAHDHGVVHRDIKPENLLLDREGRVKVADFGIAKMLRAETGTGEVGVAETAAGTPRYMAPEQRERGATDHRADIYSLGVVLYELLTGELPGDRLEPPSRKVRIDVRLDEIVLRALERTPELRYATATQLRTQLESVAASGANAVAPASPGPLTQAQADALHADPANWSRWGFYRCACDPRLVVPKRHAAFGWTVNFAHRGAWWPLSAFSAPAIGMSLLMTDSSTPGWVLGVFGVLYVLCVAWCCAQLSLVKTERRMPALLPALLAVGVIFGVMGVVGFGRRGMESVAHEYAKAADDAAKPYRESVAGAAPLQRVFSVWKRLGEAEAVRAFIETDWERRPLFPSGSPLGMSERQFVEGRHALNKATMMEVSVGSDILNGLIKAVHAEGDAARQRGHFSKATRCYEALIACGRALQSSDAIVEILRMHGAPMQKLGREGLKQIQSESVYTVTGYPWRAVIDGSAVELVAVGDVPGGKDAGLCQGAGYLPTRWWTPGGQSIAETVEWSKRFSSESTHEGVSGDSLGSRKAFVVRVTGGGSPQLFSVGSASFVSRYMELDKASSCLAYMVNRHAPDERDTEVSVTLSVGEFRSVITERVSGVKTQLEHIELDGSRIVYNREAGGFLVFFKVPPTANANIRTCDYRLRIKDVHGLWHRVAEVPNDVVVGQMIEPGTVMVSYKVDADYKIKPGDECVLEERPIRTVIFKNVALVPSALAQSGKTPAAAASGSGAAVASAAAKSPVARP